MPDLSDDIETAATSPASASADGVSVTQRSIAEMIAADKHIKADEAGTKPRLGMRFVKLVPPGSV